MQTPLDRPGHQCGQISLSAPVGEGKCCRGFIKSIDDNNDTLTTPSRPWARYLGPFQDSVRMMRRDKNCCIYEQKDDAGEHVIDKKSVPRARAGSTWRGHSAKMEKQKSCMEPNIGSGVQTPHKIAVIDGSVGKPGTARTETKQLGVDNGPACRRDVPQMTFSEHVECMTGP